MFVACSGPPPGCIPSPTQLRIEPSHVNGRDRISLGSSRRPRVILIRHKAGARVLTGGGPSASCLLLAEQRKKNLTSPSLPKHSSITIWSASSDPNTLFHLPLCVHGLGYRCTALTMFQVHSCVCIYNYYC